MTFHILAVINTKVNSICTDRETERERKKTKRRNKSSKVIYVLKYLLSKDKRGREKNENVK